MVVGIIVMLSALLIKKYNHDYWIGLQTKLQVAHLQQQHKKESQSQLLAWLIWIGCVLMIMILSLFAWVDGWLGLRTLSTLT